MSEPHELALEEILRDMGQALVAFSGGVDSSVLLHASHRVLGTSAAGFIADSPSLPRRELESAQRFARAHGARLVVARTDELSRGGYLANAGDRCFHCKTALFEAMQAWAAPRGWRVLAFGEITDDLMDHRPGARAAALFQVRAPLREAGFGKGEVRAYARKHGLDVADKPASACLSSRIPLGSRVTLERLQRVERAEEALLPLGFRVLRVRDFHPLARVEIGSDELERALAARQDFERALAFAYERVEIAPYRPGGSLTSAGPWPGARRS